MPDEDHKSRRIEPSSEAHSGLYGLVTAGEGSEGPATCADRPSPAFTDSHSQLWALLDVSTLRLLWASPGMRFAGILVVL